MSSLSVDVQPDALPQKSRQGIFTWGVSLLIVSAILSIPFFIIFGSVFVPADGIWQHLYETVLLDYVSNSLLLATGVGVCVLLLGISTAWVITMYRFPGRTFFKWGLLLPLAMPAYIIAYTYTGLLDVSGPLQGWMREFFNWHYGDYWFPQIRSLGGAIAMLSLVLYPYVYLLSRAAFIEQSVCVLEVSRTLGCGPGKVFFRVGLPLARPAIVAGLSLVLMETLADYGTVQYFGVSTFTTGIFRTWFGLGSSTAAAQLAAMLMTFTLLLLILENWSRRQARYHHTSTKYTELPWIKLSGWKMATASIFCALPVLFGFVIPASQLLRWALQTWKDVFNQEFLLLIMNSLQLAIISAVIAVLLALFITYGKRMQPNILTRSAVRVLSTGYAIPGTVIAVGVLIPFAWLDNTIDAWFRQYFSFGTGLLLSGTLVALVFAYMVRFLAISLNAVDAGLAKIKPSMEEAGRSMGYRPDQILRKVHMPMMKGSILTAALLVFVDVLKELPATLILRPFNFNTLAIRTYELANEERLAEAASPALMIVLAGILPVIYLSRTLSRSRPGYEQRARTR